MSDIILYGNGCPKCNVIENKLKTGKIEYIKSQDTDKLMAGGFKSFPVLEVNGKMMDFLTANTWVNERRQNHGN